MKRPDEIRKHFLEELDKHMLDLKAGKAEQSFEIRDIAALLHIHPTHLSNTIQEELAAEELDWLDKNFPEGAFAGTRYATPQMGMVVH